MARDSHLLQWLARDRDSTDTHNVRTHSEANAVLYPVTIFEEIKRPQREAFHSLWFNGVVFKRSNFKCSAPHTLSWHGTLIQNSQIFVEVDMSNSLLTHATLILVHLLSAAPQTWWPCEESLMEIKMKSNMVNTWNNHKCCDNSRGR